MPQEEARHPSRSARSDLGPTDPAFERAYAQMMEKALAVSQGERKRRLQEEHGQAEKMLAARVLWPVLGSFEHLHPEYRIRDLREGSRFADFAYVPSRSFGLLIELDGFGPHRRDISRRQFDSDLERQNLLMIAGWKMLRFSYDGVAAKPLRCRQTLLLALAKWGQTAAGAGEAIRLGAYERAILHFGLSYEGEKITPSLVAKELELERHTAAKYMRSLEQKGMLSPIYSRSGRRMGYALTIPDLRG